MFWQRPTFIANFQSLPRQISQFWGHFENRLEKNEKNRIGLNKCDICTLDIMTDFHWNNEANRWRSEISLIRSYADILLHTSVIMSRSIVVSRRDIRKDEHDNHVLQILRHTLQFKWKTQNQLEKTVYSKMLQLLVAVPSSFEEILICQLCPRF